MPLQPGYKAQKAERQEFEAIPAGVYQAEITDINEVERAKYRKPDEKEKVLDIEFVILDEGEAKARRLWKKVRPFVVAGEKPSLLYQLMTHALARPDLPEDEALATDVGVLIGKQLMLVVDKKQGRESMFNNITAFSVARSYVNPVDVSAPPKATEDRETTIKAIFATARKLYPTLPAAPEPKEALKEFVRRDFAIAVKSWSEASLEELSVVYMAMKNEESKRVMGGMKAPEIKIDDIPF